MTEHSLSLSSTAPAPHRLDPLLRPASLAIVGASPRTGSVGKGLLDQMALGGFRGPLYAINPRYEEIAGQPCYPDFAALPEVPEHAIFAVADARLEPLFDAALVAGVKAMTLFNPLSDEAGGEGLRHRIQAKAKEAGVLICGANGMGFYNIHHGVYACGFPTRSDHRPGGVAFITHAGGTFGAMIDGEARLDYSIAVSAGQELTTDMADYMDFALSDPATRVIGLFMESARRPEAFCAALERAERQNVPVVALKVGRSALSARLSESHTGALVGRDEAYQAIFARYGVHRVDDLTELAFTLIAFSQTAPLGPGGLATIHDSGGERELLADLAEQEGVPLAKLGPETEAELARHLGPGLPPINPLDAWGGGDDFSTTFPACLETMAKDRDSAAVALMANRTAGGNHYIEHPESVRRALTNAGKPCFLVSNHQGSGFDQVAIDLTREGVPTLDGTRPFLRAVKHLFTRRDRGRPEAVAPKPNAQVAIWQERLAASKQALGEHESLSLLEAFGVPCVAREIVEDEEALTAAYGRLGPSVVLKSAQPGLLHKSDVGGVVLGIHSLEQAVADYHDLSARLGPVCLMAREADGVVAELIFGLLRDETFGPLVVVGAGGLHAEVMKDRAFAIPPVSPEAAAGLIAQLKFFPLLDGARGRPRADLDALARSFAEFSQLAAALADDLDSLDVNPVLALSEGCLAVDALAMPRRKS